MLQPMRATTFEEYQQRLARVVEHIESDLSAGLVVDDLARIANFSPFHFHRVFRGMVGETVKAYVKRLRLERAAFALNYTDRTVTDVALDAGYESHEAFTRAFRGRFGCAPRDFRSSPTGQRSRAFVPDEPACDVEVRTSDELRVAYVRSVGPWESIAAAFETLYGFLGRKGIAVEGGALGISYDDPVVTDPAKLRFDAAAPVSADVEGEGEVKVRTIAGGPHAVTRYRGPYMEMHASYVELVGRWFPRSGHEPADAGCLEFYLNDPHSTPPEDLLTEIWVPIAE